MKTAVPMPQSISCKPVFEKNAAHSAPVSAAGSVLIVEDEEDLAVLLEYNLKKAGYQTHLADNGRKALQLAEQIIPDVILLDILLPEISGWEVCRRLRDHEKDEMASIPIIMLTALRDDRDKYRGLELGAEVFIKKPYAMQEVLLHCRNLVQNRRRHLSLIRRCGKAAEGQNDDIYKILFHELKNQLTIIGGMTGFLGRENRCTRERKYIEAIQMSADYLEAIAREVKILAQICEHKNVVPQDSISLRELITEVIALISPLAYKKNIAVQFTCRDTVFQFRQSKTAVKIILVILLENALKYSPPHSAVRIELKKSDRGIMFAVSDNGPGIEHEEQLKIFDKSYRTREAREKFSGTGLGLYFAKKLADSMQCSLCVKSSPGKGSTFTCAFPV